MRLPFPRRSYKMSEQYRPGGMIAGNSLNAPTQLRQPDGIDRIKELLNSHIDSLSNSNNIIEGVINRIIGATLMPTSAANPTPPLAERSIYNLINDIEMLDRRMNEQLARFRESLP